MADMMFFECKFYLIGLFIATAARNWGYMMLFA